MKQKWISRKDAAKILGVHPQTISNYAERQIIHERKRKGFNFYPLAEIEALALVPDLKTTEQLQAEISAMQEEIEEKYTLTKKDYELRKADFYRNMNGRGNWLRYKDIIRTAIDITAKDCLTERENSIMQSVLDLEPLETIADRFALTYERTRQVFQKAVRAAARYPDKIQKRMDALIKEKDEYQAENDSLKHENERLKLQLLTQNSKTLAVSEDEFKEKAASLELYRTVYPFYLKIADLGLSVRTYNCLRAAEIKTLGDLVSYKGNEIMKFRNFGKKSYYELVNLLNHYNLRFGMWKNPLRKERTSASPL